MINNNDNNVQFTLNGFEEYVSWQSEDRKTIKKINKLIVSILRDGALAGEGNPEILKHQQNEYSRRIDTKNRLVYRIPENGKVIIVSCKTHYKDT